MADTLTLNELIEEVIQWGHNKGILKNASADKQLLKGLEELGETAMAVHKLDRPEIIDGIGDVVVTQILFMEVMNIDVIDVITKGSEVAVPFRSYTDGELSAEFMTSNLFGNFADMTTDYLKNEPSLELRCTGVIELLSALALEIESTLEECLLAAYNEIKGRTGKTVNGVFIKDVH